MSMFTEQPGLNELMKNEVDEIMELRGAPGNTHECYARMADATETAVATTKEWKKLRDNMWDACKDGDCDAFDAYAASLRDTALMSALNWLTVAAEAERALGRHG